MIRVALFNDTGEQPHVGCRAVGDAHERMIQRAGGTVAWRFRVNQTAAIWTGSRSGARAALAGTAYEQAVRECDAVVINAEGTIHHGAGLHLLAVADRAIELAKPVLVVNGVFQQIPEYHDTLRRCTDITVRDLRSAAYLTELKVPHRLVPDSILEAGFAEEAQRDLSGRVVVTDFHHERDRDVGRAMQGLLVDLAERGCYDPMEHPARAEGWRSVVAEWKTADLVVTGRHHGVYVALMAGVPFVALPSNTWKVEGALEMVGLSWALWKPGENLRDCCTMAMERAGEFAEAGKRLRAQVPLSTFAALSDATLNRAGAA